MKYFFTLIVCCFCLQLNAQYCIPTYNPDPAIFVHNFNIGDLVNRNSEAGINGYVDYTQSNFTTNLEIGRTYPFTASSVYSAGIKGDFAIWIDYNDDAVFSIDERVHYVTDVNHYTSAMLEIPNDASILGIRRLRISYVWTSSVLDDPCGDFNVGETEDYHVNFIADPIDQDYYCMPFDALNVDNFIIDEFIFGDLSNITSGSNDYNYSLYSEAEFTGNYILGNEYEFYITNDTMAENNGEFTAWIDFNDNQIFENSEIILQEGPDIFSFQGMVTIPIDSSYLGKRRLRIRADWNADYPIDPCAFNTGTETEDYTINIVTEIPTATTERLEDLFEASIFPNPAAEVLYLKFKPAGNFEFQIVNLLGKIEKIGTDNIQGIYPIDIHSLGTGMYVLKIRSGKFEQQLKFFKK